MELIEKMKHSKLFTQTNGILIILVMLFLSISISQRATAENNPPELTLEITTVPEYLFGSATYATPISFQILGCEGAKIISIVGKFKWENKAKEFSIGGRYGPQDGAKNDDDSHSLDYTCFVPSSFYDGVLCEAENFDHRNWHSEFELTVTFIPFYKNSAHPTVTLTSIPDSGKIPKVFVDERLTCVELPVTIPGLIPAAVPKTIDLDDASQQLAIRRNGLTQFRQYQTFIASTITYSPSRIVSKPLDGFHTTSDEASATTTMSAAMMQARTRLYDDTDYVFTRGTRDGYEARAYGLSNGGYFYVSYGGKMVEPVSEPVIDLGKFSGNFELDLFSGSNSVELKSISSGGLDVSSAGAGAGASAFGLLWAIAPAGPWAMAFGTASSIFSAISAVDRDGAAGKDSADGCAFWITGRNSVADTPAATAPPIVNTLTVSSTDGTAYRHDLRIASQPCNTGDQWTFALVLNSSVNAEAKPVVSPLISTVTSVDCLSDVRYTASSAADLRDMKVTTHP